LQTGASYRITGNVRPAKRAKSVLLSSLDNTTFKLALGKPYCHHHMMTPTKKKFALAAAGGAAIIIFAIIKLIFTLNGS
jgi:hypothetical protein